ncbi:sulfotransferase family protein [Patiriisocius hiemis]|uniref:Sulfotransferase family protein n=1 Tax=Patiriisocius hiemis TaxID=3075604 RepID=A0ABU2YE40_9FLAO|nr:sulfotransferase family protein [Constantimarinum sp. W242]MDT0556463.1 sulfotransferase family protein [Constantimarinum sp. W242]
MKVINLISGPRNLSTAIMYSFAQRNDTKVVDEPYYGYYLKHASIVVKHPSEEEIAATMDTSKEAITNNIEKLSEKSNMFVKGMAHHYFSNTPKHILNWNNVILIRHPKKLITSFSKVIDNPSINDIGIKKAAELFLYLQKKNKTPIVIDSDELLKDPEGYLKKLCALLHIPFQSEMLSWKKGGIKEDGVWAKHWYKNVHNSTGFSAQKSSSNAMPERFNALLDEALSYYEILKKEILKN